MAINRNHITLDQIGVLVEFPVFDWDKASNEGIKSDREREAKCSIADEWSLIHAVHQLEYQANREKTNNYAIE